MKAYFLQKYRPGRLVIWFGLLYLISLAFMVPLKMLFHPQEWVLWVSGAALIFVLPEPKWVRR